MRIILPNHVIREQLSREKVRQGKVKEALSLAEEAMLRAPSYAGPHVAAAEALLAAGHRQQAFGELRFALQKSNYRGILMRSSLERAENAQEFLESLPEFQEARGL